jgi:putative N6-adenine-specific DNA methylase
MAGQNNCYFAVTTPGFESVCAGELQQLKINSSLQFGGIEFHGGLSELYLANLWLRSASRILVRLGELSARDFPTLHKRLLRLPWGRFIKPGTLCNVRVVCHRSRLSHSGRVAETTLQAIYKSLGAEADPQGRSQQVLVRIEDDRCLVSIDSSGELLHRRGYRQARVAAPIRENLAAGCLLALGYDGSLPLLDAMTGSGTFAIEAALIALRRAPGAKRSFAFMDWPKYRPGLWAQLLQQAQQQEKTELAAPIYAVDNNLKAIAAAELNLSSAALQGLVRIQCQPMQQLVADSVHGLIICNPPYGERIGRTAALQALYRDIGRVYGEVFATWQGALVCPDAELIRSTAIPFAPLLRFSNGGIRVTLLKKPQS